MFIPKSVWDESFRYKFGIFEIMGADTVLMMMKDQFDHKVGMTN